MFNFELYKEGLRKTKVWGVLFAISMLMGAIIQPIMHLTSHADNLRRATEHDWWFVEPILIIRGLDAFVLMPLTFIVAVPLLTLTIFAFLNGRNSSDFYHAIPHKRETLFISFLGSILTWSVGILFITTAISVGIYASSGYTNVYFGSILLTLLSMVVVSLLVMGGIALAMTVTGTVLSNVTTAGLILFLPRLLLWMFIALIETRTPVITIFNFPSWVHPRHNLLFGFFDNQFRFRELLTGSMVYTLVLGLIYLVLAGYLFKRRHSEMASNPGSKWSQPVIRIAITFALTLPALTMILQYEDIGTVFIFYLIAFIGYFAYEVFTARKIHSVKRMLPGLAVVILLNVLFGAGVGITSRYFMREINVAQITSATLDFNNWSGSYVALNMEQIEITDEQVARLLGEELNNFINGNVKLGSNHRVNVMFTFDDGHQLNRVLHLPLESKFVVWLMDYEPYRELYLSVPRNFHSAWTWPGDLTQAQIQSVLDVLEVELQEIDFEAWYLLVGMFSHQHQAWFWDDVIDDWAVEMPVEYGRIELSGQIGGMNYWHYFPITEITPRTLALYLYYIDGADGHYDD